MPAKTLPTRAPTTGHTNEHIFGKSAKHHVLTNWRTFEDQSMSLETLTDVFADRIPMARVPSFLTKDECDKMLEIVKTHQIGSYDTEMVWPRIGVAGITLYDHLNDRQRYWDLGGEARSLQNRWKKEAGIDIMDRVITLLRETSGMNVRLASEGDKEYFAGVLRAVDKGIGVHADYAPFEAHGWEISKIAAQVTWNILLNEVPGGDTLVYDRQWQAPDDDLAFRKEFPRYAYHPQVIQGHPFKAIKAVRGDLTFFNPRNFHEVKPVDTSKDRPVSDIRFTVSSFVGFLPPTELEPATLVLWS